MNDPFDLSQYVTSFKKFSDFAPKTFQFVNFDDIFANLAESIKMRQAGISIGFGIPENAFINVDYYDASNPYAIVDSVERFQDAIREMVQGELIDEFGRLPDCDIYVGFFNDETGTPITDINTIAFNGIDFSAVPNPDSFSNIVEFAKEISKNINEIIYSLNKIRYLHGKMYFKYPFDRTCSPSAVTPPVGPMPPVVIPPGGIINPPIVPPGGTPPVIPPDNPPVLPPVTPPVTPPVNPSVPPSSPPPTPPSPPPPTPPSPPPPTPPSPPPPPPPPPGSGYYQYYYYDAGGPVVVVVASDSQGLFFEQGQSSIKSGSYMNLLTEDSTYTAFGYNTEEI